VLQRGLHHDNPLLRAAAAEALEAVPPQSRLPLAWHLVQDPIRAVRIQAARQLATVPRAQLTEAQHAVLERSLAEYIATQQANAERPEAHVNLGLLYTEQGRFAEAEAAYQMALKRQPAFVPASVNLADLYRLQDRDDAGERILRQARTSVPRNAQVAHVLGLLLVRQKRYDEALEALAQAATLSPEVPRYSYVYAVALHSTGKPQEAIRLLEEAHARHRYDRDIVSALVTFHEQLGHQEAARRYADTLRALSPHVPQGRRQSVP
jgi:tetratricopeptide (TPR) repeat protein